MNILNHIKQKYPYYLILTAIVCALVYNQYARPFQQVQQDRIDQAVNEEAKDLNLMYRKLDGVPVEKLEEVAPRNFAVMVENNVEAWPLSGIGGASVVYEVLSEGRIPRLLTIYPSTADEEKIGPVRSARPYFVELAAAFDPVYTHVGGSPAGLARIKDLGLIDLDEFFWSQYLWRSSDRYAPHNTYTSLELLNESIEKRDIEDVSVFDGWIYKDPALLDIDPDTADLNAYKDIIIDYTNSTYQAKYVFDPFKNKYRRYQAKELLITKEGDYVWVDNVIVEEHRHTVLDSVGRREIPIAGEGRAWIFRDGKVIDGRWVRDEADRMTRYVDEQGGEIELNRGKTWINIVEPDNFEY